MHMALPVIKRARRQDSKTNQSSSPYERDLLIDDKDWQTIDNPVIADLLARGLFILKAAIDRGPEGVREASEAILANIESVYLHTHEHRAALRLYLLSLTGQLKPEDEPLQLINRAIERGMAQIELANKTGGKKRRR
jgi:hypothetical protein